MEYLSPTTFIKFHKQCEYRVYLEKVKKVLPKEEYNKDQTMAAATGVAVDTMIKGALNRRIDVDRELKEKILEKNQAALLLARELFECYQRGPLQALKAEGIAYGGVDQEVELEWCDPQQKVWKSILYGMPDLALKSGEVLDWKCQGMFGQGTRPRDGYIRCFVFGKHHSMHMKDIGSSPKGDDQVPMEQINEDWAIQLYLYNRLLGHNPGAPLRAGIENICVEYKPQPTVYCASFRNPISREFQLTIERAFHSAFGRLTSNDEAKIEPPNAVKYRCISYGKLCPVALFCPSYLQATENAARPLT